MVNEAGSVRNDLSYYCIAVEKCDLCGYSKRPFYCKSCVNGGNFCYSTSLYHRPIGDVSESTLYTPYHVKHRLWCEVKANKEKLFSRLNEIYSSQEDAHKKQTLIEEKRFHIKILKENVKILEDKLEKGTSSCTETKSGNQKAHQMVALVKAKIKKISEHIKGVQMKFPILDEELASVKDKLARRRRNLIANVVDDIFPVSSPVITKSSDSMELMANSIHKTVNLLRDATRTAYIQGRWVYADSGWDQIYRVLTATLPGNGDYSSCWTAGGITETIRSPGELQVSPTLNIIAGLSFLNHMIQAFAFILDIRLPFRLRLKEFYRLDLTEKLFNRAVSRLNKNVATLCFYQNVDRKKLHGLHTVINILNLLRTPDLGCDLPQTHRQPDTEERNNAVGDSIFQFFDDDFADGNDEEDAPTRAKTSTDIDWEYVPSGLPDYWEPSSDQHSYFSSAVASTSGVTNIVTSFWKAIGGSGDK